MSEQEGIYNKSFFDKQALSSSLVAREVLNILFEYFIPTSVIDIGCGRGSWLAAAETLGSKHLKGIDGSWVNKHELLSDNIIFSPFDLEKQLKIEERFDLCISIEVAEHIEKKRSVSFIHDLCKLSDIVLFSAAIKHQKGAGHINTQWASYWVDIFDSFDYKCYDVIRWRIWNNKSIDWWFRQNVFLFVKHSSITICEKTLRKDQQPIVNIVHPENYEFLCELFGYTIDDPE